MAIDSLKSKLFDYVEKCRYTYNKMQNFFKQGIDFVDRNELTVKVQKNINCYLFNAYYLCILLAYDNMYPWFYENYIQLYFNANKPVNFDDKKEV